MKDIFFQRKKDVLNKKDKSSSGKWDEKILKLCEKINSFENYYTTSSCSGRIIIMKDEEKKSPELFEFVSHYLVDFLELEEYFKKVKQNKNFKFKQEPMILHVACRDLKSAEKLLKKAQEAGFKHCGVISLGKNIVVEIASTEKIDFPLIVDGKLLVNEKFLQAVLDRANKNLEKGWEKIEKLEKNF